MRTLILLGATGDLATNKIYPALWQLESLGNLDNVEIIGASRRTWNNDEFRQFLQKSAKFKSKPSPDFFEKFSFQELEFSDIHCFESLTKRVSDSSEVFIYFASPPSTYSEIISKLIDIVPHNDERFRILIEKPFGNDQSSAKQLEDQLETVFSPRQIYRVDHILGRDVLTNIIKFRLSNPMFHALFNSDFIDHIQVNYCETATIDGREEFYDATGAIRDMIQSHMLEALSLVLAKFDLIKKDDGKYDYSLISKLKSAAVRQLQFKNLAVAQYEGYKQHTAISSNSVTETFAAIELVTASEIPVFMKTGKALEDKYFDIHVVFSDNNILTFRIDPNPGINIRLVIEGNEKIDLTYCYRGTNLLEPYANVLAAAFANERDLFLSEEEVMVNWSLTDQIRKELSNQINNKGGIEIYQPGSKGPRAAEELINSKGRVWLGNDISQFCRI